MGRTSSGAWTVYESLRIELSYLVKMSLIQKDCILSFRIQWTDQRGNSCGEISCISSYLGPAASNYLELSYLITDKGTGSNIHRNYKIYLYEQASNLGKGMVLYFICPVSGKKCRIIYSAYGAENFKSKESYKKRLYYDCQIASKLSKYNQTYWRIDKHLQKIKNQSCSGQRTYGSILTKNAIRYNNLADKQFKMDALRWTLGMPKCLKNKII